MSDELRIVKMSGAGNDFVVLGPDEARLVAGDEAGWARRLCRRGLSVGADGLLIVEPAGPDRLRVRYHNADGSAAFCGNGSRCAARFGHARGLAGETMTLETAAGEVAASVAGSRVRLTLPPPRDEGPLTLEVQGVSLAGRRIAAGVPHFVVVRADAAVAPLERWGPEICAHAAFGAEGTNVDLLARAGGGPIAIRTWERGVGRETLACGSGAVAAAFVCAAGVRQRVRVVPASGATLDVELVGSPGDPTAVHLTGEARFVLEGRLHAEASAHGEAR